MMRVAVLGAGYFAQFHIDGWQRIAEVDLAGVADLDLCKAQASGAPAFADFAAMLDETRPDIVDIVVPPSGHADAIKTALIYKPRVIICQKPFCTSLAEAEDLTALADATDTILIIHENFRFQPWFRAVKDSIARGDIGDTLQATFRLRPGDGQGKDAYLSRQPYFRQMSQLLIHETGVHYVDVFRFLFDNPVSVYADLRRINQVIAGEDAGFVLFEHTNNVRCLLDGNRCLDHSAENTRCTMGEGLFEGTKGTLNLFGDGSVRLRRFGSQSETEILRPNTSHNFGGDCTFFLQSHIIAGLRHEFPLENQATTYLSVLRIEKAIYQSDITNTKVILRPDGSYAE